VENLVTWDNLYDRIGVDEESIEIATNFTNRALENKEFKINITKTETMVG